MMQMILRNTVCRMMGHMWGFNTLLDAVPPYWGDRKAWVEERLNRKCSACGLSIRECI